MTEQLRAERIEEAGTAVVVLAGELDIATAEHAEQVMADGFDLLDLSDLEFIDSIGIRVLIRSRAQSAERLQVRGVRPAVHRVLDLAGVLEEFVFIDATTDRSSSLS